jgi:UDP-N-acetylmuramoylalanine-D-glutamate ligase
MMMEFQDKKVAILGFAVEGQAMADLLLARGARVTVYDDKELSSEVRSPYESQSAVFRVAPFGDLTQFDYISRTPGIRPDRLEIVQAKAAGVPIISTTKLFLAEAKGFVIGVTGTKGKGTTSQLLYNIISSARDNVFLGGNIGQSPLKFLPQLNDQSITILELSSFQLADVTKSPHLAIVLMVTSEHLDYHKDLDEYIEAKAGITKFQTADDTVIYNSDYTASVRIADIVSGCCAGKASGGTTVPNGEKFQQEFFVLFRHSIREKLLLGSSSALLEFVDTTGGINNLGLTGVVRVRGARDFHLVEGVLFTVLPFVGLGGCDGRGNEKTLAGRHILEDYEAVGV